MNDTNKSPVCVPAKFTTPDYTHAAWAVEVPDITLADVLSPNFWTHVADRIHVHDTIEVISPTWDALLRVTVAGDNLVMVRLIYSNATEATRANQVPKKTGNISFIPGKGYRVGPGVFYPTRAEAEASA